MLTSLSIKNYALIDNLQVEFNNGLTIITGETGAGKSILLGGLSLILGKRADLSMVKNTSKKCIVEAVFDVVNYSLKPLFKSQELDYETQTIIRREILPSGKSRAFVNDTPVNLNSLTVLGNRLLDIHSQHQTLQLTDDTFQFMVIDALAKNTDDLGVYKTELNNYKEIKKELLKLNNQKYEAIKEYDYNTFLLNELESAQLVKNELQSLEEEYETLNNVEDIRESLLESLEILNNEEQGIINRLNEIKQTLSKISEYSKNYTSIFERVDSTLIELKDVFLEIENLQSQVEADPQRLDVVNNKLQTLHNLMHKHSVLTIEELIEIRERLKSKIILSENLEGLIEDKENDLLNVEKSLNDIALKIHNKRIKVIPELIQELETILSTLGMENAKFKIELRDSTSYLSNGKDELSFLFSGNKGAAFLDLKKAASGGELSRIMLSIKSILSNYMQMPTIMFDEIDTGVSGEISNKMALIMKQMSKTMQVFTITHLPQIAAKGDSHFKVYKEDIDEVTQTQLKKLSQQDRIVEIAQMLGGTNVSNSAMNHAKELLN